jgi:hypothetical protein
MIVSKVSSFFRGRFKPPGYVRAAHYFSDGWVLNFWQIADPQRVAPELRQVKADGYNTVILVVPWRGFRPDPSAVDIDQFFWQQLRMVIEAASDEKLMILLRVSYGHHSLPHRGVTSFSEFQRLLFDPDLQQAWSAYLQQVNVLASEYKQVLGVFLSWEEFWGPLSALQNLAQAAREFMGKKIGFLDWCCEQGLDFEAIPQPQEVSHRHYHRFKNEKIRQMYHLADHAVPGVGMEMRVDRDPCHSDIGVEWLENDTFCDASARYSYWAPFMGAENEGERLSAEDSAGLLEHMLREVMQQSQGVGHLVDQFNFVDDSYDEESMLARIETVQVGEFLRLAAPLLRRYSRGYGIWAPRDYHLNILYNARFLMGLEGWDVIKGTPESHWKQAGVCMPSGSCIRQILSSPVAALQRNIPVESFEIELQSSQASGAVELFINLNSSGWISLQADAQASCLRTRIPVLNGDIWENGIQLLIENRGVDVEIDTVLVYHRSYRNGIRDTEGEPGPLLEALRRLNSGS